MRKQIATLNVWIDTEPLPCHLAYATWDSVSMS